MNTVAQHWFESIQRASMEGGGALAIAWILCRALRTMPAWTQCWLWRLAFAKILFALCSTLTIDAPLLPSEPNVVAPLSILSPEPIVAEPLRSARTTSTPAPVEATRLQPATIAFGLWIIGILVSLFALTRQLIAAKQIRRRAISTVPTSLVEITARLASELKLTTPVVFVSDSITKPLLLGILQPTIIFPSRLETNERQLSLMLAHELAHLKRRDLVWNWLAAATQALFWFHPAIWLGAREWRLAQEMACDEIALRRNPADAVELGSILIDLVSRKGAPVPPIVTAGLIETKSTVARRLRSMKIIQQGQGWSRALAVAVLTVAALAALPWKIVAQKPPTDPANAPVLADVPLVNKPSEGVTNHDLSRMNPELMKRYFPGLNGAKPVQTDKSESKADDASERDLLVKELAIAQKQLDTVRRAHDASRASSEDVAARQRDLERLKRDLAEMDGNRKAYRDSLTDELTLLNQLRAAEENRIKVGASSGEELLKLDREVLQLSRKLAAANNFGTKPATEPVAKKSATDPNVQLFPMVNGRVVSVYVKYGSKVKENEILVRLDDREGQIRLRTAQSKLQMAEADFKIKDLDWKAIDASTPAQLKERWNLERVRGTAELEIARQDIERAELDLENHLVRAPKAGFIVTIPAVGARAMEASPIASYIPDADEPEAK